MLKSTLPRMKSNFDQKLDHKQLTQWYKKNKRDLPWRKNKDPYQIWLSEVMLQQTTVAAVIPYFEKFLSKFPNVHDLANAPEPQVLEAWAGLGYYSRARNLHRASQALAKDGFPQTAEALQKLPGFGPYTSRAVASIAFKEKVGVLDGNVIRVLSRRHGLKLQWWNQKGRSELQKLSDQLAALGVPDVVNQALMELGATVCTPKKVACLLCPWNKSCVARQDDIVNKLPLARPRKKTEVWLWNPHIWIKGQKVALVKNDYAPFLKGQMLFPGKVSVQKNKPEDYDAKHSITHHDIYIKIQTQPRPLKKVIWVDLNDLKKINPSSLLQKVLQKV
jgi:A/G-specific adenine glycosylase